jgi:hypothetical protein
MTPAQDAVAYRAALLDDPAKLAAWLDAMLSPRQVVEEFPHLATSVESLANMRFRKAGPRYWKPPGRASHIAYRRLDILRYLDAHIVGTADDPIEQPVAPLRVLDGGR